MSIAAALHAGDLRKLVSSSRTKTGVSCYCLDAIALYCSVLLVGAGICIYDHGLFNLVFAPMLHARLSMSYRFCRMLESWKPATLFGKRGRSYKRLLKTMVKL